MNARLTEADALAAKLSFNLQLSDDEAIRDTMPLIELGVDSLVAVEVRTWFMQEAGVDLPVLKILGGASIADLVNDAMTKLPQDLLSRFEATSPAESSDTSALSTESAPSANTLPSQVSPNGDEVVVEKELSMLIVGATKELAASVV